MMFSEVTKINSPPPADMHEKEVGSLLFRDYDDAMITINGGKSVQNNDTLSFSDPYHDYLNLVMKLKNKEIHGMALDRFTMIYVLWSTYYVEMGHMDSYWNETFLKSVKDRITYANSLISVRIPTKTSEAYSYGVLVKRHEDYFYLKSAAEDLRQTIKRTWNQDYHDLLSLTFTNLTKLALYSAKREVYSYSGSYFKNTMIGVAAMVVLICVFGIVYESVRRRELSRENERRSNKL